MEKIKAYISKTRFWVLVAVVLMVIIAVVVIFKKAENAEETPYEKNRKTVAALEKADISHTENALKDLESRDGSEGSQGEERDTVELINCPFQSHRFRLPYHWQCSGTVSPPQTCR